jgi:uncharacterized protein
MPSRLSRLPLACSPRGCIVVVAASWRARLLGLAGLRALPARTGLLLPRCRSVHTFGMRFALDLVWLDGAGTVLRIDRGVPPGRVRSCRAANAVVEFAASGGPAGEDEPDRDHGDTGDDRHERPRAERHGGEHGERDRTGARQHGRRHPRVLVGEREVIDETLRAIALSAARALP